MTLPTRPPFPARTVLYDPAGEPLATVEPSAELWQRLARGETVISTHFALPWSLYPAKPGLAERPLGPQIALTVERIRDCPVGWLLFGRDQGFGHVLRRAFPREPCAAGEDEWGDALRHSILRAIQKWR